MKDKKRLHFPILLKVILLGIIASFIAGTVAVVVSYNNMISKAKEDLNADGIAALEYANTYYALDSTTRKTDSFEVVRDKVIEGYDYVKNVELSNYSSFKDYEKEFENAYPYFYPKGLPGSKDYFEFKRVYNDITDTLFNASFYASQYTFYAMKDPTNPNRFIFITDSRMGTSMEKNVFYFCVGSHYDLKPTDQIFDIGHSYIKGYRLGSYETRFIEIKSDDSGDVETIGYLFAAYETSRVSSDYAPILRNEILILLGSGLAVIILYAVLSYFMFVRNINKLNKAAVDVSNQLKANKPLKTINPNIKSRDEIKTLEDSFILMQDQIVNYVDIIKKDAKEKEKINAELEIASKIQLDSLPNNKCDDYNCSLRAYIKPAKEVSGDFYDYFYLDDHRLVVSICDVSGKGIPASLFMMKGKELIKSAVESYDNLVDAINSVNNMLAKNNKELLFITSFIGVIDFKKNEIKYVNAGHEKPYIVSDNKVTKLDGESNIVLGVEEGYEFKAESHKFNKGDYLFMFTDGLNESINASEEEFGYERIEKTIASTSELPLEEVINKVNKNLNDFIGKKEQFDDITMILIRNKKAEFDLHYEKKDYSIINEIVDKFNDSFSYLEEKTRSSVGIIIDELVNNLVSYEKREDLVIDIHFEYVNGDLKLTITSNGKDYDPFKNHKEKFLDKFHSEIAPGGFGLIIVKDLTKSHKYFYKDGHSIIELVL